jgi:sec-independent protein translocase protein TatA
MVGVAQLVRASDCGSEGHGFESRRSPQSEEYDLAAVSACGGRKSMLAIFGTIGPWEIMIIAGIAILIFGGRLPQVGKNLGKGIVEFKKGLKGIEEDVEKAGDKSLKQADARVKEEEEEEKAKEKEKEKEEA